MLRTFKFHRYQILCQSLTEISELDHDLLPSSLWEISLSYFSPSVERTFPPCFFSMRGDSSSNSIPKNPFNFMYCSGFHGTRRFNQDVLTIFGGQSWFSTTLLCWLCFNIPVRPRKFCWRFCLQFVVLVSRKSICLNFLCLIVENGYLSSLIVSLKFILIKIWFAHKKVYLKSKLFFFHKSL